MEIISFDSHKRYTVVVVEDAKGNILREGRIKHERGAITDFLRQFTAGSNVAVETIGNWYWIVDEIEEAAMKPLLVHARKAKMMMGCTNKTDRLDVLGLNRLQRTGTLPSVWIPPGDLRDKRDLPRSRMFMVNQRTRLKNRLHSTLDKYALALSGVSDIYGKTGMALFATMLTITLNGHFAKLVIQFQPTVKNGRQNMLLNYMKDYAIKKATKRRWELWPVTLRRPAIGY